MEDAAGELVSLAASHALFIRQFALWREYLEDAAPDPSDALVAAAAEVARSAPAHAELIAEDVSEPLVALAELAHPALVADPEDRPTAVVKSELLRSVGNVLSGLFTPLVAYARDARAAARQGSLDGIKDVSKQVAQALLFTGTASVATLIAGWPAEFGWLAAVVALLKMKFKS